MFDQAESRTTDQQLMALTAAGDRRAFEQLVERHRAAVARLTRLVTGEGAAAEDAMQQTFLAVFQHASTFRADASVRTWILTIARNAAHRLARKTIHEDIVEKPEIELGIEAGWGSPDPEAMAIAAETRGALEAAISTLSAEDREVLLLRDVEGLTGAEAASLIGVGERALKSRLHRARLRLAAALRQSAKRDSFFREGNPT